MKSIKQSTLILVNREGMGQADHALQMTLIQKYFQLLNENDQLPALICFYADGVKLVKHDSPVLESLQALEAKGVHLVVCSTCLNFFGLQDQIAVGIPGGMTDIIEAQFKADKVVTL